MLRKISPIDWFAAVVITSLVLMVYGKWFDEGWLFWTGTIMFAGCLGIIGRFVYQILKVAKVLAEDNPTEFFCTHH